MKILLIHTYYTLKGGEDAVFEQEFLRLQQDNDVNSLIFYNKTGWKGGVEFMCSIWNVVAARRLRNKIKSFKPDFIHIHNFHFSSGPIFIRTARKMGVPMVLTLHNYRLLCPSAILLFKGQIYTESMRQDFPWKAIKDKVYRDSTFATFWLAFIIWFHKKIKTWDQIDRFIALTDFSRTLFLSSKLNLDARRIVVKANFVEKLDATLDLSASSFLFVGRLSQEKGIHTLLEAFKQTEAILNIVGDGPLAALVKSVSAETPNINYLGSLSAVEVRQMMTQSTALIVPSVWYEGMPMTMLEAFSIGLPVMASNIGAMSTMITDGYNGKHFTAGDAKSLSGCVHDWQSLTFLQKLKFNINVLGDYFDKYTPEQNIIQLLKIYQAI